MKSVQFFPLPIWYFMFRIKILIFWEKWIDSGPIFYISKSFFEQNHYKKPVFCPWEIIKKSFRRKLLKIFHFLTLWIWLFGIFDKRPQGCHEVKNSMGILQGPRLMAWTTKSPILENHWVPWGCMAHLGSVNPFFKLITSEQLSNWHLASFFSSLEWKNHKAGPLFVRLTSLKTFCISDF